MDPLGIEILANQKKGTTMESTYSLHCSSFFWFNQIYNEDPIR